jgi:hypothetical protein
MDRYGSYGSASSSLATSCSADRPYTCLVAADWGGIGLLLPVRAHVTVDAVGHLSALLARPDALHDFAQTGLRPVARLA